MERMIKVTGKGKLAVRPDTIQLNIRAEGVCPEYPEAVTKSAEHTAAIRSAIEKAGLDPKELKTANFSVDSKYEGYSDERGNWKQRFVGYEYQHALYIKFDNDNEQLGKALSELTKCSYPAEFSIGHTVKDPDAVKTQLLAKAVEDSREKAEVLAAAAGVKLGKIVTINYSWGELQIYEQPMKRMALAEGAAAYDNEDAFDLDIEADDIDVQDTVTVVWEILD